MNAYTFTRASVVKNPPFGDADYNAAGGDRHLRVHNLLQLNVGYPWALWGTLFYLAVSVLFLTGAKHPLQGFMLLGTGTHAYLVYIMVRDGFWCLSYSTPAGVLLHIFRDRRPIDSC
jgi:hypothetical protein